jgi:hypothetical protein
MLNDSKEIDMLDSVVGGIKKEIVECNDKIVRCE